MSFNVILASDGAAQVRREGISTDHVPIRTPGAPSRSEHVAETRNLPASVATIPSDGRQRIFPMEILSGTCQIPAAVGIPA